MESKTGAKEQKAYALKELVERKDKAGIINYLLKGLEKKYKPERGSYMIVFETPDKASNFKVIINGSEIHIRVPNSKGSQKEYYTRNLLLKSKAFFSNLSDFMKFYTQYKNNKHIVSYELPTRTRSKESLEEKAASFSI